MAGKSIISNYVSEKIGTADICKFLEREELHLSDGYNFILEKEGEKAFFIIRSKKNEIVFTNYAIIQMKGDNATTTRRLVNRYEYYKTKISNVRYESAGRIDADVEIKFTLEVKNEPIIECSIDINYKEAEKAIDLYKCLSEISRTQDLHSEYLQDDLDALNKANEALNRLQLQMNPIELVEQLTRFNSEWIRSARNRSKGDYKNIFEKYFSY